MVDQILLNEIKRSLLAGHTAEVSGDDSKARDARARAGRLLAGVRCTATPAVWNRACNAVGLGIDTAERLIQLAQRPQAA